MARVLLELERLRNTQNGLGQFCLNLAQALPEKKKLKYTYLVPPKSLKLFENAIALKPWHKLLPPPQAKTPIWHVTHQESKYWPWPAAWLIGFEWFREWYYRNSEHQVKVVMTLHDLNFLEGNRYGKFRKRLKLAMLQNRINRCAAVVCISEYTKSQAEHHLVWPKGQVQRIIYNGNCLDRTLIPEPIPQLVGRKPFVCSIGIHPKKQYHKLLPLLAAEPELCWIIAGSGQEKYQDQMRQTATELGCAERLVLCGGIAEAQKLWMYQESEALWFPSGAEGFGLPVTEAWSVGKPAFLWSGTSLTEIGADFGFFWENWEPEHLQAVWQSGMSAWKRDRKFAEGAQKRAKTFDWKQTAEQYAALYQELL